MTFIHKNCTKKEEENKEDNLKMKKKKIYLIINAPMLTNWVQIEITKIFLKTIQVYHYHFYFLIMIFSHFMLLKHVQI